MSLGVAYSLTMQGLQATLVAVEAHCGGGLPTIHIVGRADTAVREAGDRLRSAFSNAELPWPRQRLTLSLSPADIPKTGAHFDLAIALAILAAQGYVPPLSSPHQPMALLGEVGLDGRILPVHGVLPMAAAAYDAGIRTLIVPAANRAEAALVAGLRVLSADHLTALVAVLRRATTESEDAAAIASLSPSGGEIAPSESSAELSGELPPSSPSAAPAGIPDESPLPTDVDFADIRGQRQAVEAALIAAAGGHNLLMLGPPGAGKSMIAQRLPTILPTLSYSHSLEVTAIHSLRRHLNPTHPLITRPPFEAPHAGITAAALLGGGSGYAAPGVVSLAHRGVLFLDECTEIPTATLDMLRTPLQDGEVRISRSKGTVTYPSRCQLVLAGNSCPCGAPSPRECRCSSATRARYRARLSGPLLDRVDLRIRVEPVGLAALTEEGGVSSAELRERVVSARHRAAARWGSDYTNADVPEALLHHQRPSPSALRPVHGQLRAGVLSARGLSRIMRVSWTLADLANKPAPTVTEVSAAMRLRCPLDDL